MILLAATALLAAAPGPPARARVTFRADHVVERQAQGLADRATRRPVRVEDPVRIASISKLAVAMAVMRLVDQRRLDLDRDVSTGLGWRLRHPAFPDTPITLRLLLSHTSGVRDAAGYTLGLDGDLPALLAQPGAWDTGHAPGGYFSYANLNFPIIAAIMESATGERFDRLMARLVFRPLGLDACFNWTTCSSRAVRRGIVLYRASGEVAHDDLHGSRPRCPGAAARDGGCDLARYVLARNGAFFSPQGGMRIAMTDLARLGMVLAGRRPGFLSSASLATMTSPAWRYDGRNGDTERGFFCGYGLGVMLLALPGRPADCHDDPFGDGAPRIGHPGEAYGLRSGLWVDATTGTGTAFFTSAVPDDAPTGPRSSFTAAEEAAITGWK